MLPDPSGAGSLSPLLGLRTEGIACSTVYPGPLAFGSARAAKLRSELKLLTSEGFEDAF